MIKNYDSGILLHLSSLPSAYGIGSLGKEAFAFADFLSAAGARFWQTLPICPTSFGDSPYQSPSAFGGNLYFIDLPSFYADGLLTKSELDGAEVDGGSVDYGKLFSDRFAVLRKAFGRFEPSAAYRKFVADNGFWLDDYALFMALKTKFGFAPWWEFPKPFRTRRGLSAEHIGALESECGFWRFAQFVFYAQLDKLKKYAESKNVAFIGDMPIYVARDSADVWANNNLFCLDENLNPVGVAGVPPDYFAQNGQLWGNPLYDWNAMQKDGYRWWQRRIMHALRFFDKIRIDHFRAFESYYVVPFGAENAVNGKWVKGVGLDIFNRMKPRLNGRIIAEDLGIITDDVRKMLKKSGFPGMSVLQFAFDGKPTNEYLPDNVTDNTAYYTGTHDNDTLSGWYHSLDADARRAYDAATKRRNDENAVFAGIRAVMQSKARLAVVPMQDFLRLPSDARMNTPSEKSGNWRWRLPDGYADVVDDVKKLISFRPNVRRRAD